MRDVAREGTARNSVAGVLRKLGRFDEARQEVLRAIECDAPFGHASQPWKACEVVLTDIETDAGNASATAEAKRRATAFYLAFYATAAKIKSLMAASASM